MRYLESHAGERIGIGGVLLDVDGTLLSAGRAIDGASDLVRRIRDLGLPFRLVTNTTRRPRAAVASLLRDVGIDVDERDVLTPAILARMRVLESGRPRASLLVTDDTMVDFQGVESDPETPQWVVVGDLGAGFTWDVLNRAFRALLDGARLLALQKNRYWRPGPEGLCIDAGPFVAALEYAAGVEAELVGKPAADFFRLALGELRLEPGTVLMIGDDLRNDCGGAAAAGCRTALVRTGKYRPGDLESVRDVRPDLVLDSVASLSFRE